MALCSCLSSLATTKWQQGQSSEVGCAAKQQIPSIFYSPIWLQRGAHSGENPCLRNSQYLLIVFLFRTVLRERRKGCDCHLSSSSTELCGAIRHSDWQCRLAFKG